MYAEHTTKLPSFALEDDGGIVGFLTLANIFQLRGNCTAWRFMQSHVAKAWIPGYSSIQKRGFGSSR